jgi:DNA-binding MarR family transcriptional regulator
MTKTAPIDPIEEARAYWDDVGLSGGTTYEFMSSIYRVVQDMLSDIEVMLKRYQLNSKNFFALLTLAPRGELGLPMGQLAKHIKVHQTTVTVILDQLEKQGLVRRQPHPKDRRVTLAVLTPAGQALVRQASESLADLNFGLPQVSVAKQETVINVLREVRTKSGDIPAAT